MEPRQSDRGRAEKCAPVPMTRVSFACPEGQHRGQSLTVSAGPILDCRSVQVMPWGRTLGRAGSRDAKRTLLRNRLLVGRAAQGGLYAVFYVERVTSAEAADACHRKSNPSCRVGAVARNGSGNAHWHRFSPARMGWRPAMAVTRPRFPVRSMSTGRNLSGASTLSRRVLEGGRCQSKSL